jgi:prefoldin subunit 5
MNNQDIKTKNQLFAYEKQIQYLQQRIQELETELFKKECELRSKQPSKLNKKEELMVALSYLNNKTVKTKQDKESIYSLGMVLKNMK